MNFNPQPPSAFVYLVSHKSYLIKIAQPFNIYRHRKYRGPTLTGASFVSASEV
jgi:hypothetical protein